jgi:hypothetical protein
VVADEPFLVKTNAVAGVAAAVVGAAAVVLRFAPAVPIAVVVLAAAYAALLGHEVDRIDARAPLVAAALFALSELAYWSTELRGAVADEPGTYLRRAALLAISLLGVILIGTVLLTLVETVDASGIAVEIIGAAAAVVALALVALSARRAPP